MFSSVAFINGASESIHQVGTRGCEDIVFTVFKVVDGVDRTVGAYRRYAEWRDEYVYPVLTVMVKVLIVVAAGLYAMVKVMVDRFVLECEASKEIDMDLDKLNRETAAELGVYVPLKRTDKVLPAPSQDELDRVRMERSK